MDDRQPAQQPQRDWLRVATVPVVATVPDPPPADAPRKRGRRRAPKEVAADIARLCDYFGYLRNDDGALAAVWRALKDGLLRIPRELPRKRGRGQPAYNYAKTLQDWAEGRKVAPLRAKWGLEERLKLLADTDRLKNSAGRRLPNKMIASARGMSQRSFERQYAKARRLRDWALKDTLPEKTPPK